MALKKSNSRRYINQLLGEHLWCCGINFQKISFSQFVNHIFPFQYDTGHNNIIGFAYAYPPEITPTVTVMKGGIGQNFIKVYVSAHEKNDKKTPVKINMEFAIWVEGYDQISLDQMRRMKASAAITSLSLLLGQTTREFTETYNTYYEGETNGLPTVFTTKTIDGKWEVDFKKVN